MDILEINEILQKILDYLRPIDIIICKTVNRNFYDNAAKILSIKFDKSPIFTKYFKDFSSFKKIFANDCIISGSAML